jgi:hypothetical protein
VYVHDPLVADVVPPPDPLQQLAPGIDPARRCRQRREQVKLQRCQLDHDTVDAHLSTPGVDGQPVEALGVTGRR